MSEMLNSLLPGHEQAVKTARDKLRASTLWLLADRTWHSWVDLKLFLTLCVKEEDALAQYALWEAGQASPSRENMLLEEREGYGGSLLVSSAIDSLVTDGLCQVRGEGWARQIQRVRLDASSRSQVRAMQEAYVKALHTAQGWLDAG